MGKQTGISYAHHTWSPWWGCTKVSEGCANCYAETVATNRAGLSVWGPDADRRLFGIRHWCEPQRWNRSAHRAGERRRVLPSMCDPFEDHPKLENARAQFWALVEQTHWLDWLLLTKRPENIMRMIPGRWQACLPPNVWVGATVENQEWADQRVPELLQVPAAIRWLSIEPALGPVDLHRIRHPSGGTFDALSKKAGIAFKSGAGIDWVVVGGESGSKARACDLDWNRAIVNQCKRAAVPVYVKQLGSRVTGCWGDWGAEPTFRDGRFVLRDRKGGDPAEWPTDLQVREYPEVDHAA
jgi:protein gp37